MFEDYEYSNSIDLSDPACRARVRVLFVDAATSAGFPHDATPLERKRSTVWANTYRNLQIARIADALANYELDSLWQEGLFLGDTEYPEVADGPVSVLVESLEHGEVLSELLRHWPFLHAIPESLPDREAFFDLGSFNNTIYTLVAADQLEVFDPQVLVVASGGDWAPEIFGYPPTNPYRQMLVIDFADDFDEQAMMATRNRFRQYLARGWQVEAAERWQIWPTSVGSPKKRRPEHRPPTPAEEAQEYLDQLNS